MAVHNSTPRFIAWKNEVGEFLSSERGRKTELAKFLVKETGKPLQNAHNLIQGLVNGNRSTSGPVVLAVQYWIENIATKKIGR